MVAEVEKKTYVDSSAQIAIEKVTQADQSTRVDVATETPSLNIS